mgnify:CR=1 FL=1|tara:strand:+ start:1345 stop:1644 length:300 start_codon:yes stop_codon:yes gene_type:complete
MQMFNYRISYYLLASDERMSQKDHAPVIEVLRGDKYGPMGALIAGTRAEKIAADGAYDIKVTKAHPKTNQPISSYSLIVDPITKGLTWSADKTETKYER